MNIPRRKSIGDDLSLVEQGNNMQKKNFLLKVRRTRRSYFLVYFMILIIIGVLIYFNINGLAIPTFTLVISIGFIILLVKFTEIHRMRHWWAITDSTLIQSVGLLNKNMREVSFSSISDVGINKPLFKRLLNYGDVTVRIFLNETSIKIKNISNPERFVENFQSIISQDRKNNALFFEGFSEDTKIGRKIKK
ncbi:MAG: PH domain-containing protein [Nanoarchaeota archaeon]|nr:PH domain-containing protein [Nanoarchaeota archaeon]MBU1445342.1 PH domain-containing protein [Nanoarchaeota archaeon]MBU2406890.1 PH domain-containing protein [Nanoarchaeota archaeon]MBU2420380.1 PH domain-containing protein [Nanoarchaeota archaeon]MBU2475726.1 PH domain-containing protein [Nanoarchaeota archaeon]